MNFSIGSLSALLGTRLRALHLQVVAGTNYAFQFQAYFDCTSQQGSGSFGSVTLDAIVFKPLENAKQNIIPPQVCCLLFCMPDSFGLVPHWESPRKGAFLSLVASRYTSIDVWAA